MICNKQAEGAFAKLSEEERPYYVLKLLGELQTQIIAETEIQGMIEEGVDDKDDE